MKKVQCLLLVLFAVILVGCGGGGATAGSFPTHTPKIGYWEIQDAVTGSVVYKGFATPSVLMLDQNNLSWDASFSFSSESTSNSVTNIKYTFVAFHPEDNSQAFTHPEFPMNDAGIESSTITLYGNNIKLIFDPENIHNSVDITPNQFSNLSWTDQRDNRNTFNTTNTTFTIVSNSTALAGGDCSFEGRLPTTTINYASIQVNYSCTTGATGTTYVNMTTNASLNQMIIGINGDNNLQSYTMLFK